MISFHRSCPLLGPSGRCGGLQALQGHSRTPQQGLTPWPAGRPSTDLSPPFLWAEQTEVKPMSGIFPSPSWIFNMGRLINCVKRGEGTEITPHPGDMSSFPELRLHLQCPPASVLGDECVVDDWVVAHPGSTCSCGGLSPTSREEGHPSLTLSRDPEGKLRPKTLGPSQRLGQGKLSLLSNLMCRTFCVGWRAFTGGQLASVFTQLTRPEKTQHNINFWTNNIQFENYEFEWETGLVLES